MCHSFIFIRKPHFWDFHSSVTILAPNHYDIIKATQGNSKKTFETLNTLRGHSENTQRIPREHTENTQRKFRKHLENTFLRPANAFLFSADSRISVTQSANISRWSLLIAVRIIFREISHFHSDLNTKMKFISPYTKLKPSRALIILADFYINMIPS